MNTRAKGLRIQRKAVAYTLAFADTDAIPLYQVSRRAQKQPFDLVVLRKNYWPRFVEVRANQWRTGRASTVHLMQLPGEGYLKQIWLFTDGTDTPRIREWTGQQWSVLDAPWESSA